jgi:antitoxin (DNA-binding transcriptional repressor) of toxin-antitoxin stability system
MRTADLKILEGKLSEYVRLVASGETVLVTDQGRVVAGIVPPQPGRSPHAADAIWEDTVRAGLITPAAAPAGKPPLRRPIMKFEALMQELERDREEDG